MSLRIGAMLPEVLRHLFKKPATVPYPFQKLAVPKNYRGSPVMNCDLCIGCQMCVRDCPSEALEIHKESESADAEGKVKKRFSMVLYLDRCTHCAQCQEVCPKNAIHLNSDFEMAAFNRGDLKIIYK